MVGDAVQIFWAGAAGETLTLQLRGHLMLTIPEVEQLAGQLAEDTTPRVTALADVDEARTRLDLEPGSNLPAGIPHAQRLARSVLALCTHYENLTQTVAYVRMPDHGASCTADCKKVDDDGSTGSCGRPRGPGPAPP
ncbi:DUF6415 family natural product biosynthesis protein [Streptomyces sp. NPDC048751]|uniref:DUF6415 family natural product biosynthesis protein n=1 Tax=Streptomyces sp. NPDC048751 TaxID=3365591 RepID=UPI00371076F4